MVSFPGSNDESEEEHSLPSKQKVALTQREIWKRELKPLVALSVPVGISQLSRISMSVTDTLFLVSDFEQIIR
jgi:Na+-driven multidrug efflux pump